LSYRPISAASPARSSTRRTAALASVPGFGGLHGMGGAELYAGNTAEMWASLVPWTRVTPGVAP